MDHFSSNDCHVIRLGYTISELIGAMQRGYGEGVLQHLSLQLTLLYQYIMIEGSHLIPYVFLYVYKLRVYIRENIEVISSRLGFCFKSVPSLGFIDKQLRMFGSQNGISTDNMRFGYSESKGGISGMKSLQWW